CERSCFFLFHSYAQLVRVGGRDYNASPKYLQATGEIHDLCKRKGAPTCCRIGQPRSVGQRTRCSDCCRSVDLEDSAPCPTLATKLRPDRTLVVVGPAGGTAGGCSAGLPGSTAHESAFFSAAGSGHFDHLRDLAFRHARELSG